MATLVYAPTAQSTLETSRSWLFDFTPDLPAGAVVTGVAATHEPPSGTPLTPTVGGAVAPGIYPVALGQLLVLGLHYLNAIATLSSGGQSHIRLAIPVSY